MMQATTRWFVGGFVLLASLSSLLSSDLLAASVFALAALTLMMGDARRRHE